MKQKDSDQQGVADLLKKLQETFLSPDKKSKRKKDGEDLDDRKFQEKLAAMIGRMTSPKPAKKKDDTLAWLSENGDEEDAIAVSVQADEPSELTASNEAQETPQKKRGGKTSNSKKAPQKKSSRTKIPKTEPPFPTNSNTSPTETTDETQIAPIAYETEQTETKLLSNEPTEQATASVEHDETFEEALEEPLEKETPMSVHRQEDEPPVLQEISVEEPTEKPTLTVDRARDSAESFVIEAEEITPPQEQAVFVKEREEDVNEVPLLKTATEIAKTEDPDTKEDQKATLTRKKPIKRDKPTEAPSPIADDKEIAVPSVISKAEQQQDTSQSQKSETDKPMASPSKPIVIKPREKVPDVTLPTPSAEAPDFAKQPKQIIPDSIVIRPQPHRLPEPETIVIRPRTVERSHPTPQIQETTTNASPIKIGKEVSAEPVRSEQPKPSMKKEQNTTFIPPSADTSALSRRPNSPSKARMDKQQPKRNDTYPENGQAPQNTAVKQRPTTKKPNVSLPNTPSQKTPFASPRSKKKPRKINQVPVTTLNDEGLDEVLDEAIENDTLIEIPVDEPEDVAAQTQAATPVRRRAQKQPDNGLSAMDMVKRNSGLTEDDIAMIFELGYENELGRLVGYENLKRLKTEHLKKTGRNDHKQYRTSFGYRGEEYAGAQQKTGILAAYSHDCKHLTFRLILTSLLTLLLFLIESPQLIGGQLTALSDGYPFLFPLAGLGLFALVALLSLKQITAGLRRFFKFSPTPYSVPALLAPITVLYDLLLLAVGNGEMLKVNFLSALALLFTVICDVLRLTCERRTLRLISAEGEKHVLLPAPPRKKKLRQGDKIVKIINDDIGENLYQVRKSTNAVGFFRRFNTMDSAARPFTVFIGTGLAISVLLAFAEALRTQSATAALSAFMTVLLLSVPVCAMFGFFYPLVRANRVLSRMECALVGEEAVEEFDRKKTVIFHDTDLYTAEKCTEIAVREGDDFKNDMRLSGILFRKLGGTLRHIGESAPAPKTDPPVAVVRIQESGVEAVIDNRYHILAGDAEFLMRGGVRVPRESTDKTLRRTLNVSLMYVAIDGVLKLSYEIEYNTKPTFEEMARDLADSDNAVAIYSYDPNLDEIFLQKSRPDSMEQVRVIKPGRYEEERVLEMADTGAVAIKNNTDLAYPLHAAKGIGRIRRFGFRIQLIASILGGALAVTLTLLGKQSFLGTLFIAAYQFLWITVFLIATHSELNAEKLRFRK